MDWRTQGIRVVRGGEKSGDTPDHARHEPRGRDQRHVGPGRRSCGPGRTASSPARRQGRTTTASCESVIYVVHGHALMRWGDRLEWITKAGPGDFLHVPAWVPHQELNASDDEELHCVLVRSGPEELVVNLELEPVAEPDWVPNVF